MSAGFRSKDLTFVALMAALGNVFSFISIHLAPIIPSIPLGLGMSFSLALDFSHLTTFIAALFGGPVLGGLTGLLGGLVAAFEFGFSQGNIITGFGLPAGKAMTGVAAGLVMARFRVSENRLMMVMATVIAYIPEALFTAFIFISLLPIFFSVPFFIATAITVQILVKAFVEMVAMGLLLTGMLGNQGFTDYLKEFFT